MKKNLVAIAVYCGKNLEKTSKIATRYWVDLETFFKTLATLTTHRPALLTL